VSIRLSARVATPRALAEHRQPEIREGSRDHVRIIDSPQPIE
jgi:hypothetical protein